MPVFSLSKNIHTFVSLNRRRHKRTQGLIAYRYVFCLYVFCLCVLFSSAVLSAQQTVPAFTAPEQPQVSFAVQEDSPKAPQQLQNVAQAFRQLPVPKLTEEKQLPAEQSAVKSVVQPAAFSVEKKSEMLTLPAQTSGSGSEINSSEINSDLAGEKNTEESTEERSEKISKGEALLDQPLTLGKNEKSKDTVKKPKLTSQFAPVISVIGSLLIVLSAFLFMALLFKKLSRQTGRIFPSEAFENLGKTNLSPKIQLQLLRLGNRLLLVSVSSDGVSTLTEITDPDEVVMLLGMCRKQDKNSATALFQKTLTEVINPETENTDYFGGSQTSAAHQSKYQNEYQSQYKSGGHKPAAARGSHLDLASEPESGLAGILASGIPNKGGRYV